MRKVRKDIAKALDLLGLGDAELSLLFVGRRRMKLLNTVYRGIPDETDVLSFPMADTASFPFSPSYPFPTGPSRLLGDIVISVPKAEKQSKDCGSTFHDELLRLLIHGLLHLVGYDHEAGRGKRLRMEKKEGELFHALQGMD